MATFPLYLLPDTAARFLNAEDNYEGLVTSKSIVGTQLQSDPVAEDLALRLVYEIAAQSERSNTYQLRLTQGPATLLRSYLSSREDVPWTQSFRTRIDIAGRDVGAWVAEGSGTRYVIFELGDTLIIAEGPLPWFDEQYAQLLAQLFPAST